MNKVVRHLAGQRLVLGFDGTRFNSDLEVLIGRFQAGGIILFRQNIVSPEQVAQLCADVQAFAASCGQPPLFIAVDQEGGVVSRLPAPFTQFDGNPLIRTREAANAFARITARELHDVGINMNLAPVVDVVSDHTGAIMNTRAFPGDAWTVADLGTAVIQTLQSYGVMAVAKHFPGIGRTVLDSHHLLPVLDVELAVLQAADLIPFEAAVRADVSGIMVSHILCSQLDPRWQASLSVTIAHDMIRQGLGFDGLVLTDDLDMKAIHHDMDTCMGRILAAGIDLALVCHQGPNIEKVFEALVRRLDGDTKTLDMGRVCVERIYRYKQQYLGWTPPKNVSGG
ncbi:MAG: glycoside hydrolase family 3 N-terminal domain-containing protein [Desulfotignum sp.]